jgi:hypothetical protein
MTDAQFAEVLCFASVFREAASLATHELGDDRLEIVFDNTDDLKSRVRLACDVMSRRELPLDLRLKVNDPVFRDSKEILPLQAADLLAYETYKEIRNRHEEPPRPVSVALERLVTNRLHTASFIDTEVFWWMKTYLDEHPDELNGVGVPSKILYKWPLSVQAIRDAYKSGFK